MLQNSDLVLKFCSIHFWVRQSGWLLDARAGRFGWNQIRYNSAEFWFDSIHYCCLTWGWGHLWTVVCIVGCTRKIINTHLFGISCKCTV